MTNQAKFYVAFNTNSKIGPASFKKIRAYFGSIKDAWGRGTWADFVRAGLDFQVADSIIQTQKKIDPDQEIAKLKKENIDVIIFEDKTYPKLLKQIYDPPALLYIRGKLKAKDEMAIGVVGTRKMTDYGNRACEKIVAGLAANGVTIVSGLALGIDSVAHKTAIESGGRTIAVLAGGIEQTNIFPPINTRIVNEILSKNAGAIISEQHIGTPNFKTHFPARNRIISGLSLGVVIIEAGEKSGALITAQAALEQNRQVFAIPGSIFSPASIGTNNLIKMGAVPVASSQDILTELNIANKIKEIKAKEVLPQTSEEKIILEVLDHQTPIHIDKLVHQTKLEINQISSVLTLMEMKGLVRNIGSGNYIKK